MFDDLGGRSSAFEAQCPVMKAYRVHGLGGVVWPPMFSLVAWSIMLKALLLPDVTTVESRLA